MSADYQLRVWISVLDWVFKFLSFLFWHPWWVVVHQFELSQNKHLVKFIKKNLKSYFGIGCSWSIKIKLSWFTCWHLENKWALRQTSVKWVWNVSLILKCKYFNSYICCIYFNIATDLVYDCSRPNIFNKLSEIRSYKMFFLRIFSAK